MDELPIYDVSATEAPTKKVTVADLLSKIFGNPIDNTKFSLSTTNTTAQYTGLLYVTISLDTTNSVVIYEDDAELILDDRGSENRIHHPFTVLIRKGHSYKYNLGTLTKSNFIPFC